MIKTSGMGRTYSTGEAAKAIGVSRQTLQAWIDTEDVTVPQLVKVGRISVRLWTDADIKKARKFKGTLKPGPRSKKKR
jgi:DNA-binding transcriptional MerR regulator